MADGDQRGRRPGPVAEIPPPAIADGTRVAKAWLVELVDRTPLAAAGTLPIAALAEEAPELCAAVLAAIGSTTALDRLLPGGDLAWLAASAGRLAGAVDPAGEVGGIGALRTALSDVLREALPRDLDAATGVALAERSAAICDVVLEASLRADFPSVADDGDHVVVALRPVAHPPADADAEVGTADAEAAPQPEPRIAPFESTGASGVAPWLAAIERLLATPDPNGAACALLLVEVDDVERLQATQDAAALDALARVEQAVESVAPLASLIAREAPGRLWVVASVLDRDEARRLGLSMARAAEELASHRGVPLTVSIGLGIGPDDGVDATALAAHADEGLFAARAAGVRLA